MVTISSFVVEEIAEGSGQFDGLGARGQMLGPNLRSVKRNRNPSN